MNIFPTFPLLPWYAFLVFFVGFLGAVFVAGRRKKPLVGIQIFLSSTLFAFIIICGEVRLALPLPPSLRTFERLESTQKLNSRKVLTVVREHNDSIAKTIEVIDDLGRTLPFFGFLATLYIALLLCALPGYSREVQFRKMTIGRQCNTLKD